MKEKVIILTRGGTGREVYQLLKEQYEVLGFLDDVQQGPDILGTLDRIEHFSGKAKFCSALGSYRSMTRRRSILERIDPSCFITFVAPEAKIYPDSKVGGGVLVFPQSVLSSQAEIGNHCLVYHNAVLSHDARIGPFTIVGNNVCVSGSATIGENGYVGSGSVILEGIRIGRNCIVAAGAVVVKPVPDDTIYISPREMRTNHYL